MKKATMLVFVLLSLGIGYASFVTAGTEDDKRMCEEYKNRLKKYEQEGVMGINPSTGKTEKMEGEAAKDVIKDTKENIQIFCF